MSGALIGNMRISKADGSQAVDLQRDALVASASIRPTSARTTLPESATTAGPRTQLEGLAGRGTLVSWKLDRLGRDLRHLVNLVDELTKRGIGLRVLAGEGANIDTTTANGRLVFGNFAALAEFELAYRRAHCGRPLKMTSAKLRLTQAAMGQPETKVGELCALPGRPSTVTSIPRVRPTGWAEVA